MAKENFTTYTEIDPNSHIEKTTDRATFTGIRRNEDAYLYNDKDPGHFNGDFEHLFEARYTNAQTNSAIIGIWGVGNLVDDLRAIEKGANGEELLVIFADYVDATHVRVQLKEYYHLGDYSNTYDGCNDDTLYYFRIKRVEADGDYGTIYCDIYTSEADRANEVNAIANLSVALHAKIDYRYIYVVQSYNSGHTYAGSGFVENLDLQELPPPPPIFPEVIYSPREKQNKKGIIYDADKKEIGYAEDVIKLDNEVVAIEDFLLPQHIFAHENNVIPVAIAGTFQDIPFNEAESTPKVGIEHDHESNPEQFKIKKAGVYLINMTCSFSDSAVVPNCHIDIRIVKNGVEIHGSLLEKDIAGGPQQDKDKTITNSILVVCELNDIIKFQFTADDLTVSLNSDATYGDHKDTAVINIVRIA